MDGLVEKIQNGDIAAYKEAYEIFYDRLYFYILKCTGSKYLSEEIVQQTFIKLWESRARLSLAYSLSTQIFRIAKSLTIDLLRKEKIEKYHTVSAHYFVTSFQDGEDRIIHREDWKLMKEKIENLPPVRKKIFKLSRFDGLSYKEIASQLSLSPKTVENHILLALKQLKNVFFIIAMFII